MNHETILTVKNLRKHFDGEPILKGINLEVRKNEVIAIIGSSGSGKSTLLRCLNFLEQADSGSIIFDDRDYMQPSANLIELRKRVGMVFQSFNLFHNRSVLGNCTLPLCLAQKMKQQEAERIARENLSKVGMLEFEHRNVDELSGGQKQRVAIARALCMEPEIMLFDEPTSALDPEKVGDVLSAISDLAKKGMTMLVVTHEIAFAKDVADRVIFIDDGVILEQGNVHEVLEHPSEDKTKRFLSRYHNSAVPV